MLPLIQLRMLQDCLRKVIRGVGGIEHSKFRAFANDRRTGEMRNFVDGDLVEQVGLLLTGTLVAG